MAAEGELDFWDHCLEGRQPRPSDTASAIANTSPACEEGEEDHHNDHESTCARRLAETFEGCLSRAKKTILGCSALLVPHQLMRRAARHALQLVAGEPCGLRGCVLYVHLELADGAVRLLEHLTCDAVVVPTSELTLVFKQDRGGGVGVGGTVGSWSAGLRQLLMGTCFSAPGFRRVIKLSPGFRLVKRKLYSGAVVVVEC
ncbi:hypothetical protein CRUP_037634 [Coryphaenoides rupestris]|nr:hypothetical protein CRUP_037634 [Coryphaenoides rupestris]